MSVRTYDFVVLGGGHNGLLSSIYLAKAGFSVCVLEANDEFGGGTRSQEIAPGYIADTGGMVHNLISKTPIVREDELGLFSKYGLEYEYLDSLCCSIFPNEEHLILYKVSGQDLRADCQVLGEGRADLSRVRELLPEAGGRCCGGDVGSHPGVRSHDEHPGHVARGPRVYPRHELLGSANRGGVV